MKKIVLAVLAIGLVFAFAACKGSEEKAEMAEAPAAAADDAYAEVRGKVVTMAGPFVDNDAVKFEESVKAFEEMTGIDIQYEGTKEFEASIGIRVEGGNPPDIVDDMLTEGSLVTSAPDSAITCSPRDSSTSR